MSSRIACGSSADHSILSHHTQNTTPRNPPRIYARKITKYLASEHHQSHVSRVEIKEELSCLAHHARKNSKYHAKIQNITAEIKILSKRIELSIPGPSSISRPSQLTLDQGNTDDHVNIDHPSSQYFHTSPPVESVNIMHRNKINPDVDFKTQTHVLCHRR